MGLLWTEVVLEFYLYFCVFFLVVDAGHAEDGGLVDVLVLVDGFGEEVGFFLLWGGAFHEVVEHVVVAFALGDGDYSALLQQVADDEGAFDVGLALAVQQQDEFAETGGVVIADGFGVAESL